MASCAPCCPHAIKVRVDSRVLVGTAGFCYLYTEDAITFYHHALQETNICYREDEESPSSMCLRASVEDQVIVPIIKGKSGLTCVPVEGVPGAAVTRTSFFDAGCPPAGTIGGDPAECEELAGPPPEGPVVGDRVYSEPVSSPGYGTLLGDAKADAVDESSGEVAWEQGTWDLMTFGANPDNPATLFEGGVAEVSADSLTANCTQTQLRVKLDGNFGIKLSYDLVSVANIDGVWVELERTRKIVTCNAGSEVILDTLPLVDPAPADLETQTVYTSIEHMWVGPDWWEDPPENWYE